MGGKAKSLNPKNWTNDRTPGNRANANQMLDSSFTTAENYFLPYEELVRLGRLQPGQNPQNLLPGQSRFGRAISTYEDQLAAADPAFARYRQTIQHGLDGIENGGIPDDLRRTITENLRSSQAQRGIIDSNVGAIEEAVRLAGGSEMVRAQRLAEQRAYFGDVTQGAIQSFLPTLGMNLGLQTNAQQFNQQRSQAGNAMLASQWGMGLNFGSDVIGAIAAGSIASGGGKPATPSGTAGTPTRPADYGTPQFA